MADQPHRTEQDIAVLREMVRLAENRRSEELEHIERVNKYNLALIAFSGSFLSLLVTQDLPILIVQVSGALLMVSMFFSLAALRPRTWRGGAVVIDEDVKIIQGGHRLDLQEYLLVTADLTDAAATSATLISRKKKAYTISAAIVLAGALIMTYALFAYA